MGDTGPEKKVDPIMEDYARKILGRDTELPEDYASMIIESRRRGRAGEEQPFLKPHRCDKHLQDFLDGLFLYEAWEPCKIYFKCLGSKMGEEPERYKLKGDPESLKR
ncbi:hypothetical protein DL89DRAFT_123403 [Linderina pennispora]|uniref:Uncharacterized protein n=1 Tax=Linderina pennispora TaxID=61395 RepID=A0A1Y1WCR5_9FUNG|nr:uncharacterized protein DL89DRAFT_123403 [Linderina pennispora]KAJ1954577.1 hypothetical protein EC988_002358 [Linderina pennispora]ORX71333.1 hypothetical protein DL89DRAFT_123403 [Linderina pennispora]